MATDEEINEVESRLYNEHYAFKQSVLQTISKVMKVGIEIGKKEGIQMERRRIREQVEKDSFKICTTEDFEDLEMDTHFMLKKEIDIWDDE